MYLKSFTIQNIKCFESLTLDFWQPDSRSARLWNVIIGENGTGKSTLLQAMAIALMGKTATSVLLPRPYGWVRTANLPNHIAAEVFTDIFGGWLDRDLITCDIREDGGEDGSEGKFPKTPYFFFSSARDQSLDDPERRAKYPNARRFSYEDFAVGYGPFRRLSGGSEQGNLIVQSQEREARFVTLFRDDAALIACEHWLKELDYARLDPSDPQRQEQSGKLLEVVRETLNQYLLPPGVQLESINSQGVFFRTPYANKVKLSDLSDGYRAMLALGIDLLRHLSLAYSELAQQNPSGWLAEVEGVVLIDELDAHLHPIWQREVSFWLKERFPKLQFIVATHSPFIPQAADEGGIYVLRRPDAAATSVQVYQDEPSVAGWRADQILTILFDTPGMYRPDVEAKLREYARLKTQFEMGLLSEVQRVRFEELRLWVQDNLAPPGETKDDMEHYRSVQRRAQELSRLFGNQEANDQS